MDIIKKESYVKDNKIYLSKSTYYETLSEHKHEFLEVVYISNGSALHSINGREYPVTRGDLFLLDYSDSHTFIKVSSDFTIITCCFLPELIDSSLLNLENAGEILKYLIFCPINDEKSEFYFSINLISKQKDFDDILENMVTEFSNKQMGYQSVLKGYLLILLSRVFRTASEKQNTNTNRDLSNAVEKALGYLKSNFSHSTSLEEIARLVLLSPNYFAAVFKNTTGCNFTDYIHKIRIDEACRLLTSSNKSILEVMNDIGYSDSKFFYSLFKRITSMTPGEYKKRRT